MTVKLRNIIVLALTNELFRRVDPFILLENMNYILVYMNIYFYIHLHENTIEASNNFIVKRMEVCNNTQYRVKFSGNISKENDDQYLNFDMSSPLDFDENISVSLEIFSKTVANQFLQLFVIREKNGCKAANTYMGQFWYDLQRAAQMLPGVCPIRAGRYAVHHHLLNFNKLALQTFPFGTLKLIFRSFDRRTANSVIFCVVSEMENIINSK